MKFHQIIFILILLLSIYNCKNKKVISFDDSSVSTIRCQNCSERMSKDFPKYDRVKFIPLETTAGCLINAIQQVVIKDTFIYIKDMNEALFAFNKDGKFIRRIGTMGHGPAEYIRLNSFYIDHINNNIVIIDGVKKIFIRFDLTGKYISYTDIPSNIDLETAQRAILTEENELILHNSINPRENIEYTIINMKNKELIGNYFSYSPINVTYQHFFSSNPMCITDEGISFIRPLNDTIYQYNTSEFSAKYVIQTPRKTPSANQIDPTPTSYDEIKKKIKDNGYFTGFEGIFETSNHLILSFTENNGIPHYFFADKRKKEGSYYMLMFSSQKDYIPFFPILTSYENSFISVAEPRHLLFRKYEFDENNETGKRFQTMLENLDEQDNPVLFFYEFD